MGSYTLFIYIRKKDVGNTKFTHANVFVALPLYEDSKLRSLKLQLGNVLKTSFRDWPYNWPEVSSIDVKFYRMPTLRPAFRCKFTYIFLITKYFLGKIRFLTKKSWLKGPQITQIDKINLKNTEFLTEEYNH